MLYKPVSEEAAKAGLRAVAALLSRERRRAIRIPVQAAVEITLPDTRKLDGILLDLSETGMEVLTAEPQTPGSLLAFRFQLPNSRYRSRSSRTGGMGQSEWANRRSFPGSSGNVIDSTEDLAGGRRSDRWC